MRSLAIILFIVSFAVVSYCQENFITSKGAADVGACSIESPSSDYCGFDQISPAVWVKNYGSVLVDSFKVMYRLDFFAPEIIHVQEEIPVGDSVLVVFDDVQANSGDHAIQFSAYFPNGMDDENESNNSVSKSFAFSNGKQYIIELMTDNYPSETSWSLVNEDAQLIIANGELEEGVLHQTVVCLATGCYIFSIVDSFGDGICAGYGDGYYSIINAETKEVLSTACDFGEGTTFEFCVGVDEGVPIANFSHGEVDVCLGEVSFYDNSFCNPEATEWLWDFGDGNTSVEQNPTHSYAFGGMYNVSLQVTNVNGTNTLSIPNFVEVVRLDPPVIDNEYFCEEGETVVFHAPDGYGDFNWFVNKENENPDLIYDSYTLENLISDSIIYYQYIYEAESQYVGLSDNSGEGGYFGFSIDRAVYFDAYTEITIKTANVYASGVGDRVFTLENSSGVVLDTKTINVSAGQSTIELDFHVSAGADYELHVNSANNLSYTGDYEGPNVGYPFTIPDLISFTGNNYSESFWYFFYNIEVVEGSGGSCPSDISPISAILDVPELSLGNDTTICKGNEVELIAENGFVSYLWNNDSNDQSITVSLPGIYSVSVTNEHSCTAASSVIVQNYEDLSYSVTVENCFSDNDGSVSIDIIDGEEPVDVLWSNGITEMNIISLMPGAYYFTLTDANGCVYNDSVMVENYSGVYRESENDNMLSIFPNPVSEILSIQSGQIGLKDFKIFDTQGRLIREDTFVDTNVSVDVSGFSRGVYFIELQDGNKKELFKIFKQ